MKIFEGTLDTFPIQKLFKWADSGEKTGSLTLSREGITKTFFFQKGKLIFASSEKEGERTGEFFVRRCGLDRDTLYKAIKTSIQLNMPFTQYLISQQIVEKETLTSWIKLFIETLLADALQWEAGSFIFTDGLPATVMNGPIKVDTSIALSELMKAVNPSPTKQGASPNIEQIVNRIVKKISENKLELPVIPDMTYKLRDLLLNKYSSLHDIARLIMSDQVLTSKILKVANSVFYGSLGRITSLQQAIITMGFTTIQSIATVYAMKRVSTKNTERVKEVLSHSFLCAFIAQRTAVEIGLDPEEYFVCSLLHDIGKTVLLDIVADYALPQDAVEALLDGYHQQVGSQLVSKWHFSDVIQSAVLYHHHPCDAPSNGKMAEAVWLSDTLAHGRASVEELKANLRTIDTGTLDLQGLIENMEGIAATVSSLQLDLG
ncbi:MAG: HDOD domain-containing protein [Thermodesulfovibrionales bacterium]|jgi:putative nucleotidyltransferase with HDIG domain